MAPAWARRAGTAFPRQSSAACWWCRASQLVVQARQRHVVALAGQMAFGVPRTSFLGTMNSEDAFDARNQFAVWPWNLGQHQVHDVFPSARGRPGDPHLVALEAVARAQRIGKALPPSGTARGHIRQRKSPACGSDRHMVPDQRPLNSLSANTCFCRSVPCTISRLALPEVSRFDPMLIDAAAKEAAGRSLDRVGQLHAANVVVLRSAQQAWIPHRRGVLISIAATPRLQRAIGPGFWCEALPDRPAG